MNTETVIVDVELTREVYERIEQQALLEHRTVAELIPSLIHNGLESRKTTREIMEMISRDYCANLEKSGERELTSQELLEKLRRDREEIVAKSYSCLDVATSPNLDCPSNLSVNIEDYLEREKRSNH
jgi:hypothetical protein